MNEPRTELSKSSLRRADESPCRDRGQAAPVTNFIGSLWGKLALNDKSLTPLADRFRITNTYPKSGQLAFKRWKLAELVTPFMLDNVRRGFIPNSDWQYLY